MAEMLLFFIPALMSLLDYGGLCAMTAGAFCW
jgi:putative effector of murein hydrolase LrgA (UPF0299 family)